MSVIANLVGIFKKNTVVKDKAEAKTAELLFEIGYLSKVKRSQVKNNPLTIADHSYRVTMISLILAEKEAKVNLEKVLTMALIHDLPETRIGDLDLINKCYVSYDEDLALSDICDGFSFKEKWLAYFKEFKEGKTKESHIVRDADILDEMITDRQLQDEGNVSAKDWLAFSQRSLKTVHGKALGRNLISGSTTSWWYNVVLKKFQSKT